MGTLAELLLTVHSMSACLDRSLSKNACLMGLCCYILLGMFVTVATCASEATVAPGEVHSTDMHRGGQAL